MSLVTYSSNGKSLQDFVDHFEAFPEEKLQLLHSLLGEAACRQIGIYPIPAGFSLSVVIPVYNERQWIREILRRVQNVPIPKEIILVDDCSTDGTREILKELEQPGIRVIYQPLNQGKGAALREGFRHATGEVVVVQDADLEYDPAEYPRLIQPIIENRADVVYGSRFIGDSHRVLYYWHYVANKAADDAVQHVHQPEPHRHGNLLQGLPPRGAGGHQPQIQSLRLRAGDHRQDRPPPRTAWRIYEIPISYSGRTYEEGKKIGMRDALNAFFCIVRYWMFD